MVNPHLPKEILLQIFSKLPAKSVGRFRALSKSWNTELSTSHFIKNHLISRKQTIQLENLALTTYDEKVIIVTSPTKEDEFLQVIVTTNPRPTMTCQFKIIGSCDGLILLNNLLLFNPITLKHVLIPLCSTKFHQDLYLFDSVYGFGYESYSDDYKILQISCYLPKGETLSANKTILVDVYSVKNCVWKRLLNDYPDGERIIMNSMNSRRNDFVSGALHWLVGRRCIAAFDLANEVFREIPLPEGFVKELQADGYYRSSGVSVAGGCLLIVDNYGDGTADIWIQREYGVEESWVKFYIRSGCGDLRWHIEAALCYVKEGELLCLTHTSSGSFLFAFDLKGGTARRVVLGEHDNGWFTCGIAFVDSLISPK